MMKVELICVGTEILLGNIVNTNAAYLAEKCAGLGLSCYFQTVVGDNEERLSQALETAIGRSDIVILSGGLGPTEDDLTKETAAKVCGRPLYLHEPSKKAIEKFFADRGTEPTENNWKQAMLPQGAIVMENHNGTAPGAIIETESARVILLPGPPNELYPMFEESAAPYLASLNSQALSSTTVKICGVGESKAETMVKDLIDGQTNPTIATYAKTGEVHIRVTASGEDKKSAAKLIKPVVKELKARFGNHVYTTEEAVTLEKSVADLLLANALTITCAESCTGGLLSARLVNVPGISGVYKFGMVTYSNKAKRRFLGVKKGTLRGQREDRGGDGKRRGPGEQGGCGGSRHWDSGAGRRHAGEARGPGVHRLLREGKDYRKEMPVLRQPGQDKGIRRVRGADPDPQLRAGIFQQGDIRKKGVLTPFFFLFFRLFWIWGIFRLPPGAVCGKIYLSESIPLMFRMSVSFLDSGGFAIYFRENFRTGGWDAFEGVLRYLK